MPIPNEDRLRERYDAMLTHYDPHSPYYDGPDGEDTCERCGNPIDDCECEEEEKPMPTLKDTEDLGHAAAQCDLFASSPDTTYAERAELRGRAAAYRDAQAELLNRRRLAAEEIGLFILETWDALRSPTAQDVYAGIAAFTGLTVVVEMVLAIFGHPLFK